jgi:hypothetical protein
MTYAIPSFSSTVVTLIVTASGSSSILQFPVNLPRQLFSQQSIGQMPAQLRLAGPRMPGTQSHHGEGPSGGVQVSKHFQFAGGSALPKQLNLQRFHFWIGVGIQPGHFESVSSELFRSAVGFMLKSDATCLNSLVHEGHEEEQLHIYLPFAFRCVLSV